MAWVEIDGARGEGGGQILRTSLALAVLTRRPVRLRRIRAKRSKPGLRPQHLTSVRAIAEISQAEVHGDAIGSQELTFVPGEVSGGTYQFNVGTAGGTGLVLHTVYLPLMLRGGRPSTVTIMGGTHNDHSPCHHFLATTWRPYLALMGLNLQLHMRRPGFYPRGGGVIEAHLEPTSGVKPFSMPSAPTAQPRLTTSGFSAVAGLPISIAERQAKQAHVRLHANGLDGDLAIESWQGGPGTVMALVLDGPPAPTLFFGLGARGKPAERVADEAVDALLDHAASDPLAVDPHSADQLVLPLVFADGPSRYRVSRVTQHLLTNVLVVRQFLEREVACEGEEGQPGSLVMA